MTIALAGAALWVQVGVTTAMYVPSCAGATVVTRSAGWRGRARSS